MYFTNNDDGASTEVRTTLWVMPKALKCSLTLDDLTKITFTAEKKEGSEKRENETYTKPEKDIGFHKVRNGIKVLKSEKELGNIAHDGAVFTLKRWREYEIQITAEWRKQETTKSFSHDTFQWNCQDVNQTKISQTQFCNGIINCPDGEDENPDMCESSGLMKKLSYILSYPIMLILVISYFVLPKIHYKQSLTKKVRTEYGIEDNNAKRKEIATRKEEFTSKYKKAHSSSSEMKILVEEMKYNLYKKGNKENPGEVSGWVKEIEDELHKNPEERYQCILNHYKASHPMIDRIADPTGGIIGKIGKIGINLNSIFLFTGLCSTIFDYVKDIGNVK